MYSITARAMLIPSKVLVPRPTSSRMIRLFLVAYFKICATSFISTIKVLCPVARSSLAPTRVKILSTGQMLACRAGIKLPICVISVKSATWRIYVDLPAMFGPVMIIMRSSVLFKLVSLGTKISRSKRRSTTGWRPSRMRISLRLFSSGLI